MASSKLVLSLFAAGLTLAAAGTRGMTAPANKPVGAPMDTCGSNCMSSDCVDGCPCGTTSNPQDIASWCAQFSGWDQGSCQCIVSHESGGNANAMNENTNGSYDVGLWQINSMNWASCSGGSAPCDPTTNLNCAIKVWQWGGNSFRLWSTCSVCGLC